VYLLFQKVVEISAQKFFKNKKILSWGEKKYFQKTFGLKKLPPFIACVNLS
tara:strand:+ start:215 stop:367 length:153 start_codon:yes stop_codon:yes gene_type:complete